VTMLHTEDASTTMVVNEMRVVMNNFEGYNVKNDPLGKGGWGKVFAAIRKSDNKKFAMKFFGYTISEPEIQAVNSEIVLMMALTGVEGSFELLHYDYDCCHSHGMFAHRCCVAGVSFL
jgi:hypothetical protein